MCAVLCLILAGCSAGSSSTAGPSSAPPPPPLKAIAENLSRSGEIGSAIVELEGALAELKKSDSAKAEAIKPLYEELVKSDGNPEKVKKAATNLASKL
jgi:hypothetical protein